MNKLAPTPSDSEALTPESLAHLLEDSEQALLRYRRFADNAADTANGMFAQITTKVIDKFIDVVRGRTSASDVDVVRALNSRPARYNLAIAITHVWDNEDIQDELRQTLVVVCDTITDKRLVKFRQTESGITWDCTLHLPTWQHLFTGWYKSVEQTTNLLRLAVDNPDLLN